MLIYYTCTSLLCHMDLPTLFFLVRSNFFFSGLTAGPTYQPQVRHSNPDTPLVVGAITLLLSIPKTVSFDGWYVHIVK